MNATVEAAEPKVSPLQLPEETASLIKASIAENTLKAYQRALQDLETWLSGQTLSDMLLANYITAIFAAVTISSRNVSTRTPHAVSFRNAHTPLVLKVSYLGIRSASDPLFRLHKPVQLLLICRSQDVGSPHRCQRIMPKPS